MKTGIPLCFAFLFFCGQPAAAQLAEVSLNLPMSGVQDNGAQGITLQVFFSLSIPSQSAWTGPGTMDYSIDSGTQTHTGTLTFNRSDTIPRFLSIPVAYSRLASGAGFSVNMSNFVNLTRNPNGFTSIFPLNFAKRTLTVTGRMTIEGNTGTTQVPFTVAIEKVIAEPITFTYVSSGGTANAGEDYTPVAGTGTIPAGSLSTAVNVAVKGDTGAEADETMGLEITDISVPVLRGTDTMTTIQNDDAAEAPAPAPAMVTEASVAGNTAKAWFSVNLAQARAVPVTCRVSTRDGSAKAGSDYAARTSEQITFAPGETQKWVFINVTATLEVETREEFFLDVEEVQSHTVKSAACTIERFAIMGIAPDTVEPGVYRLTFPAGIGQRYLIEESSTLSGTWTPASALLTGAGALLEQKVYPSTPRGFFRLRAFSQVDPGTPAAGS